MNSLLDQSEHERVIASRRFLELDFQRDESLKDIAMLASSIMHTPVSMVTILESDIQWIISPYGIDVQQMPRATSFCTQAIAQNDVMVICDTREDERFKELPLVTQQPHVRFYAGAVIKSKDGYNIGTLCVFHDKPFEPDEEQIKCLKVLGDQVSNIMNLELTLNELRKNVTAIQEQNNALRKIAFIHAHELRAPLCNALGAAELIDSEGFNIDHWSIMKSALGHMDDKISHVVSATNI